MSESLDVINRELDRLVELKANWDGHGAFPIDPQIIAAARKLAEKLPEENVGPPMVVPCRKGNLQFEWAEGPRGLELEIEDAKTIHYLKWDQRDGIEAEDIFPIEEVDRAVALVRWFARPHEMERLQKLERAAVEWVRTQEALKAELDKHGDGAISKGSPVAKAADRVRIPFRAFWALAKEAAERAGEKPTEAEETGEPLPSLGWFHCDCGR